MRVLLINVDTRFNLAIRKKIRGGTQQMIKVDKESTELEGTAVDLLAQYAILTNYLLKAITSNARDALSAKLELRRAFEIGIMTEKERHEHAERARKDREDNGDSILGMPIDEIPD